MNITEYTWNFGDGTPEISGVGLSDYNNLTHVYEKEGEYTVTVTASNKGGMTTAFLLIHIGGEDKH